MQQHTATCGPGTGSPVTARWHSKPWARSHPSVRLQRETRVCRSTWNRSTGLQEVPSAQKQPQSLSRLRRNELLPGCESPGVRSSPVLLLFLLLIPCQDQEKALDKYEAVVKSLQERSQQVLPLRFRRQPPPQPVPVEALCEYEGEQVPHPGRGSAAEAPPARGHGGGSGTGGRSRFSQAGEARQRSPSPLWEEQVLQRRSRRDLGETQPRCLSHTLGMLRQHSSVTFPRSLSWCPGVVLTKGTPHRHRPFPTRIPSSSAAGTGSV